MLMIDGKEIDGEYVIVALGVDSKAKEHILGLVQGSTENSGWAQTPHHRTYLREPMRRCPVLARQPPIRLNCAA